MKRTAWGVFLGSLALLFFLQGNRLIFMNDEGILLEPAQRVLSGQRPYVDFFAYMSPGSYWLQAAVFKIFGLSIWSGRTLVLFDFALQCSLIFWLTARFSTRRAGLTAAGLFFCFQIADPSWITAQHRWDSSTLLLAATVAALQNRWLLAGALAACGALCTPSMALVIGVWLIWLVFDGQQQRLIVPFAAGLAGISVAAVGFMALQGILPAFLGQMLWLQRNYSAVNVMPYGALIGGYASLFEGAGGAEWVVRLLIVACIAIPAWLPPAAGIYWTAKWRLSPETRFLLLTMLALLLTVFPRADVMHLAFIAALPYVLGAIAWSRSAPRHVGPALAAGLCALSAMFLVNFLNQWRRSRVDLPSPVGVLRADPMQAAQLDRLFQLVRPGSSLYVYPYMPTFYFLTQARNPTRFAYLAPGMMRAQEETAALTQLEASPPAWILYSPLSRQEFLRVFPNATSLSERFERLESWVTANYQPEANSPVSVSSYVLLHRKELQVSKAQP